MKKEVKSKTKTKAKPKVKAKSQIKEKVKGEPKIEVKEEVIKPEKKVTKDKRYLLFSVLYFACTIIWLIGAYMKAIMEAIYAFDIVIAILWLILSVIYFMRYNKGK